MSLNVTTALAATALCAVAGTQILAQGVERSEAIASSDALSQISIYSYRDGPKSDLFLRGTPLAAAAEGEARVEYQNDNARISAEVRDLPAPGSLGPYTTYMLWAVSPDGRVTSQGVIGGVEGGKGRLETQHGASQFALIVTAEPHFAVTIPSTMIVLYNVGDDVKGSESKVTTLTERVDYASLAGSRLSRVAVDKSNPVEIVQARYAIAIARAAGAERFGSDAYQMASSKLTAAESALVASKRSERRAAPGLAREAVIAGEDARRAALLAATANAAAEDQRAASAAATDAANRVARVAAAATAARTAAATATAAAASQAASQAATGVERQRAAVAARDDLRNRLNDALPTRDSNRGLIAEIGGVQFVTGAAEVNAAARESLARFSGIVASYPGLRFNVEGHTDSVGSVAMNNELSLKRAMTVRDYLIAQGVPASSIDVAGLGLSAPIGDNSTPDGRTRNRRVEIVVSGGPLIAAN